MLLGSIVGKYINLNFFYTYVSLRTTLPPYDLENTMVRQLVNL